MREHGCVVLSSIWVVVSQGLLLALFLLTYQVGKEIWDVDEVLLFEILIDDFEVSNNTLCGSHGVCEC